MSNGAKNNPYFCKAQAFAWHCETSVLRPVLSFSSPKSLIFLRKIKGSEVSFYEVDDVLPFSKHMKTSFNSLTHCIRDSGAILRLGGWGDTVTDTILGKHNTFFLTNSL